MTDKILYLSHYARQVQEGNADPLTTGNIDASGMLEAIAKGKPKNAFVIVWPENGEEPTYHSSAGDMSTVLMRLNHFIHKFYNGDFDDKTE